MKKLLMILVFISLASSTYAKEAIRGLHCGTRGNFWGTIASDLLIPDYFPPENFLLRLIVINPLLIDLSICEEQYEPVYLGESCMYHDQCYETLGAKKDDCDDALLKRWEQACNERYNVEETSDLCLDACHGSISLMYDALRYDDGSFCPSCIAFEKSQGVAKRN